MKKTNKETTLRQQKPGPRADEADGESAVLAKIAAMPGPDRAIGERLHAIIKANAPTLSPKTCGELRRLLHFQARDSAA